MHTVFVPESSNIKPVDKIKLHSSHRWADTKCTLTKQQIPFSFQLLFKQHLPEYTHIRIKHLQNHPWTISKFLLPYQKYSSLIAVKLKASGSSAQLQGHRKDHGHKCQRLGNFPWLWGNCSGFKLSNWFSEMFLLLCSTTNCHWNRFHPSLNMPVAWCLCWCPNQSYKVEVKTPPKLRTMQRYHYRIIQVLVHAINIAQNPKQMISATFLLQGYPQQSWLVH